MNRNSAGSSQPCADRSTFLRGALPNTQSFLHYNISVMDSYVYTRLHQPNEIRLLDLYPGISNQPLYGILRPLSLDQNDNFEAISYVWGTDMKDCILETTDGRINITSSLYSALKRLRLPDRSHALGRCSLYQPGR